MQFLGKFGKIVCWRPPLGSWRPLLGEILDPPLKGLPCWLVRSLILVSLCYFGLLNNSTTFGQNIRFLQVQPPHPAPNMGRPGSATTSDLGSYKSRESLNWTHHILSTPNLSSILAPQLSSQSCS